MCANECNVRRSPTPWGARAWCALHLLAGVLALTTAGRTSAAPSCRNLSAAGVSFGSYNPLSPLPLDAVGTVSYDCPPPAAPVITLSRGASPTYTPRQMTGLDALQYNLYVDAARTLIWGDGTGGTSVVNGPSGVGMTVSVYGRIFPLQNAAAGPYSDVIFVTLNF